MLLLELGLQSLPEVSGMNGQALAIADGHHHRAGRLPARDAAGLRARSTRREDADE
jgi:hypothetical protein